MFDIPQISFEKYSMAACKAASGEAIDSLSPLRIGKCASAALRAMCGLGMSVGNVDASCRVNRLKINFWRERFVVVSRG